jgi:hypothetical protein
VGAFLAVRAAGSGVVNVGGVPAVDVIPSKRGMQGGKVGITRPAAYLSRERHHAPGAHV